MQNIGIHGIRKYDVERAPTFPAIWTKIATEFASKIVVAYNAKFDIQVLLKTLARNEISPPVFRVVDAMKLAQDALFLPKYDLMSVCKNLKIKMESLHNALSDAIACRDVFTKLNGVQSHYFLVDPQQCDLSYTEDFNPRTKRLEGGIELGRDSISREKQAFLGIVFALLLGKKEGSAKRLVEWNRKNETVMNSELKKYIRFSKQIEFSNFQEDLIQNARDLANNDPDAFPSIVSLYSFVKCFVETPNDSDFLNFLIKMLRDLPEKEKPGNGAVLLQKAQGVLQSEKNLEQFNLELDVFLNPLKEIVSDASEIVFIDKKFVFTGDFSFGRENLEYAVQKIGAEVSNSITRKTDYLVVGFPVENWKLGELGGTKVQKVIKNRTNGSKTLFVREETVLAAIEQAKGRK